MDLVSHTWECPNCGASGHVSRTQAWEWLECSDCQGAVEAVGDDLPLPFVTNKSIGSKSKGKKAKKKSR